MEQHSELAANRMIKVKNHEGVKTDVNVRYRHLPYNEIFNTFSLREKTGFSTFHSCVGKQFKRARRLSDMCKFFVILLNFVISLIL